MQDWNYKLGYLLAVATVTMAFATSGWAQNEWKVGDVVVCIGNGTCQVLDVNTGTAKLIDTITDSSSVTNPGNTRGVAINNTLHLLVTDDGGPYSTNPVGANIVQYTIAGVDPYGNSLTQGVSTVFNGGGGSSGIMAVALDNAGNMYSLNSNSSSPNIVETSPAGSVGSPISLQSQCGITQVASMDLSGDGTSAYVTSQGTIRNVALPGPCGLFANLGSGVSFYGIKDIPGSATNITSNETVLVVTSGFFDSNGNGKIDSGDVNVCTNHIDQTAVSCALLLDTKGPAGSLTSPPWQANFRYSVGTQILDQNLNLEVVTATTSNSKSGRTTPNWQPSGNYTVDNNVTWLNLGTSVLARYAVSGESTLQSLALDPLLGTQAPQQCSGSLQNNNLVCSAAGRTVSGFWMADSISGKFFHLDFSGNVSPPFSASCSGCAIQGIGVYGAEGAAQPGLTPFGSTTLTSSGTGATNPASFNFNPDGNDNNEATVTGFNLQAGDLTLTAYASAINPASGISDPLLTPTPPNGTLVPIPAAPCSVTTSKTQCVVWEFDNAVPQPACTPATLSTCAFLGVQLEQALLPTNFNTLVAVDEQYNVTDTVDSGTHYLNSQISLHSFSSAPTNPVCTYATPLAPDYNSPAECVTNTRNTIPFKFGCTNLPSGISAANLLPYLHIVQFLGSPTGTVEPLLVLNGTGGTTNYRTGSGQQWVFNLNNPNLGNPATAYYLACTEDATHTVPDFCTFFNVQNSCP